MTSNEPVVIDTIGKYIFKWISNMGRFGTYSIMGGNIRLLIEKYDMNVNNVVKAWNERTSKNEELVRVCEQVKEVVEMRDRYIYVV